MNEFSLRLRYSIVAFVDILGFSNMVKSDCESGTNHLNYFSILKNLNQKTKEYTDCEVTQFSDSVIFSLPLSFENYVKMINLLSEYQFELLANGILCRGAVSLGKHFNEEGFMFSQGLIDSYGLESTTAINPRIIISKNLLEQYIEQCPEPCALNLVRERDGYYFIDYLNGRNKEILVPIMDRFKICIPTYNKSIQDKYYWLFSYFEFSFSDEMDYLPKRFIK